MTDQHPITPPPELVQEWGHDANLSGMTYIDETENWAYEQHIAACAAHWGADQELEACKQWLSLRGHAELAIKLGYCMRNKPEPPSLKEQALAALENDDIDVYLIRRALETLPE